MSKSKVISILSQKGGSGKTTIAINLADSLFCPGHFEPVLVDADVQESAYNWSMTGTPKNFQVLKNSGPGPILIKFVNSPVSSWIIVDGPPRISQQVANLIMASHLVLIPVQPSPMDVWACADIVNLIKACQKKRGGSPLAAFVVSRAIPCSKLAAEVEDAIVEYGFPVLKARTHQRVIYASSLSEGKTVFCEPKGKAAAEMIAIRDEVLEMLK